MRAPQHLQQMVKKLQRLPPAKVAEVEDFIDFLSSRDGDRSLVQAAQAVSEPALSAIWESIAIAGLNGHDLALALDAKAATARSLHLFSSEASMTRSAPFVLMAVLTGALLAGCSKSQPAATETPATSVPPAAAATPPATPASKSDVYRFRIGTLDATALKDGDIDAPNDGKTFGVGQPREQVAALLAAAGQSTDVLHLSIQPLLVRSGAQILLFDTGAADAPFARAGRLLASLRAADVEPAQVTDIFISHRHPDHVGGLLTREGKLTFPNATIHLSTPEWETFKRERDAAALVAAITPKVAAFEPGAAIVPGVVTAVAMDGHTPGHSVYEIASGDERLLYIGDTAHHFVVSVQRPDWTVLFDENAALAQSRRRALLQRAADEKLRVFAVHFPFPGLGRIEALGSGFTWVPER